MVKSFEDIFRKIKITLLEIKTLYRLGGKINEAVKLYDMCIKLLSLYIKDIRMDNMYCEHILYLKQQQDSDYSIRAVAKHNLMNEQIGKPLGELHKFDKCFSKENDNDNLLSYTGIQYINHVDKNVRELFYDLMEKARAGYKFGVGERRAKALDLYNQYSNERAKLVAFDAEFSKMFAQK
jgi:hypothetical protein